MTLCVDALLGRDFLFRMAVGNTVVLAKVTAVGYHPVLGVRLVGEGFTPAWVNEFTWRRLLKTGVLEAA